MTIVSYYLIVCMIGGALFIIDKLSAISNGKRIPENTLHFLTFIGALAIPLLIPAIKHKSAKPKFYAVSILCAIVHVSAMAAIWYLSSNIFK